LRIGVSVPRILGSARSEGLNETADMTARRAVGGPPPVRPIAGIGRVLLWPGASLWIGRRAGPVAPHAHHAVQISLALTGRVRLRSDPAGAWAEHAGVLVRPHHRHAFDGNGESVAQLFVEPETALGRAVLERHAGPLTPLPDAIAAAMAAPLATAYAKGASDDALGAAARRALATLAGEPAAAPPVDPRIARAIAGVRERLAEPVSLAEAAALAHLSPSRFRHLFAEQTGMAFRPYLLWARVGAAIEAAMHGQSWTDAAQAWGFADSAHLTRTCRRMFGIAPTMLVRE
jgi:AraC family transcriptional regulator